MAGITLGGRVGFGSASTNQQSQTELCRRLARPKQPQKSGIAAFFVMIVILAVFVVLGSVNAVAKSDPQTRSDGLIGLFVVTPLLSGFAYGLWRMKPKAEAKNKLNEERWQEAVQFWEQAFYCGRCDGLFKPGDAEIQPPEKALTVSS